MTALRIIGRHVGLTLAAGAASVVLWAVLVEVSDISPLIAPRPWDVWSFLTSTELAADQHELAAATWETVRDTGIGYVIALGASFAIAVVFSFSRLAEQIVMPTALLLRSLPIIIITPLITLLFGAGIGGVTAIVVLVVFMPSLALILIALRTAQLQYGEVVTAYGGGVTTVARKATLPASVPALLAAARVSLPLAVTGAMLGEWLATGEGLGGYIGRAAGMFAYQEMWAAAVIVTLVTMLVYMAISALEDLAQHTFRPGV